MNLGFTHEPGVAFAHARVLVRSQRVRPRQSQLRDAYVCRVRPPGGCRVGGLEHWGYLQGLGLGLGLRGYGLGIQVLASGFRVYGLQFMI
jgi:hypothetical protein